MSNLSEEEIIKIIKEYLSKIYTECTKVGAVGIPNEEWYAIQGLLDLYNKEKEKNEYALLEKEQLLEDSVSKDKIKEKIKYIKENYSEYSEFQIGKSIEFLQELLEEE